MQQAFDFSYSDEDLKVRGREMSRVTCEADKARTLAAAAQHAWLARCTHLGLDTFHEVFLCLGLCSSSRQPPATASPLACGPSARAHSPSMETGELKLTAALSQWRRIPATSRCCCDNSRA
jgi:hypothetical protein